MRIFWKDNWMSYKYFIFFWCKWIKWNFSNIRLSLVKMSNFFNRFRNRESVLFTFSVLSHFLSLPNMSSCSVMFQLSLLNGSLAKICCEERIERFLLHITVMLFLVPAISIVVCFINLICGTYNSYILQYTYASRANEKYRTLI